MNNNIAELVLANISRICSSSWCWLQTGDLKLNWEALYPDLSTILSFNLKVIDSVLIFASQFNLRKQPTANETMIKPIKKARLCIYYREPNKGLGLMPWGWGHTSSRARLIMNANKHNESKESKRGAATSFGKPLGNSTWHISGGSSYSKRAWNTLVAETMMYSHQADTDGEGKWKQEDKRLADSVFTRHCNHRC